ncbi:hypothetical protein Z043_103965 [Scleropages formosus]|uniref:PH domain-containing protein n=1 Tax=Scleropages formosus TaxID=113540 RepID=A0A0P7XN23_SCLFO|nr:hypothetical protein Z043_103965 [Scleropages formosus]
MIAGPCAVGVFVWSAAERQGAARFANASMWAGSRDRQMEKVGRRGGCSVPSPLPLEPWNHSRFKLAAVQDPGGSSEEHGKSQLEAFIHCVFLSQRAKDSVKHFQVSRSRGRYSFGFQEFPSLREFVNHFANQPLIGSETGCLIVIKCPYPRLVDEPCIYEPVLVHTAMHTGLTEKDLVANAPSLGTKEGYLVKQGAIVKVRMASSYKMFHCTLTYTDISRPSFSVDLYNCRQALGMNWKTRWFTLNRNEMKYFKDKMSVEPIRTLDLTACTAVQFDYSKNRVNCFCDTGLGEHDSWCFPRGRIICVHVPAERQTSGLRYCVGNWWVVKKKKENCLV